MRKRAAGCHFLRYLSCERTQSQQSSQTGHRNTNKRLSVYVCVSEGDEEIFSLCFFFFAVIRIQHFCWLQIGGKRASRSRTHAPGKHGRDGHFQVSALRWLSEKMFQIRCQLTLWYLVSLFSHFRPPYTQKVLSSRRSRQGSRWWNERRQGWGRETFFHIFCA